MCVVSMIMDHYHDKWAPFKTPFIQPVPPWMFPAAPGLPAAITPAEIEEFRKLLERAREYDKKHNEPDCELKEKKEKLKKFAEELGVEIGFL